MYGVPILFWIFTVTILALTIVLAIFTGISWNENKKNPDKYGFLSATILSFLLFISLIIYHFTRNTRQQPGDTSGVFSSTFKDEPYDEQDRTYLGDGGDDEDFIRKNSQFLRKRYPPRSNPVDIPRQNNMY